MQFSDLLCYVVLMVTLAVSCANADGKPQELQSIRPERRLSRRDSAVIIGNFPVEPVFNRPKIIYRRISRQKYSRPTKKYGSPRLKLKYGPPSISRKPIKKYRSKNINVKYGPPSRKHMMKPKYGPPKKTKKPFFGTQKKPLYHIPDPEGFGEPPNTYDDFEEPKQSYGEPPVDSYGTPIKKNVGDIAATTQKLVYTTNQFEDQDFENNFGDEFESLKGLQRDHHVDSYYAFSKKAPSRIKAKPQPKPELLESPLVADVHEEDLNSYSDIFNYRQALKQKEVNKKKKYNRPNPNVMVNRPYKIHKKVEPDDEIIVGGQYAEPPARYFNKFRPNSALFDDNDFESASIYGDSDFAASSHNSAYINYKNSNLAFSPQNLNDAFSIVD